MANELVIRRVSNALGEEAIVTEISRDALQGGWDVHVERPDEGDEEGNLVITLEPQDTPNRIQLTKVFGFEGADGLHYFHGIAGNGEIVYPSEGYESKTARDNAARSLADAFETEFEKEDTSSDSSPNPDVTSEEIKANEELKLEEELEAASIEEFGGGIERRRRAEQPLPVVASSSSPAAAQEVIDTAEALSADAAAAQEARDEAEKIRAGEPEELEGQATVEELIEEATREELYERASELDIPGRSQMNKEELAEAIAKAEQEG